MKNMKIQYCSDLHLEFAENKQYVNENPLIPVADILLLAGDILPFSLHDKSADFIDFVADNFEKVFWIPGNHEYYDFDLHNIQDPCCEKLRSNVFLVNNHAEYIGQTKFIFSTLWSTIQMQNSWRIQQSLSDFFAIKNNGNQFCIADFNRLHKCSMDFITKSFTENKAVNSVVVTHHVPTFLHYPEQYKNSPLNDGFVVELFEFIKETAASHWIYGHHHVNVKDFNIGETKMLTNQLGYVKYGEQAGFRRDAYFEL